MKKVIYNFIRFFDPDTFRGNLNENDERIAIVIISFIMSFIQSIYTYALGLKVDAIMLLIFSIIALLLLLLIKFKIISYSIFSHSFTFVIIFGLNAVNLDSGMINSPSMIWLGIIPIVALIQTGIFWGTIWSIFSIVLSMTLHYLYQKQILTFNEFNQFHIIQISFSNLVTGPLLFYIIFLYFFNKTKTTISSNQPLVELGQTTSFLMHEISKPINRIKNTNDYHNEDVKSIIELYTLASSLSKNASINDSQPINLDEMINKVIKKYQSYINSFRIEIKLINLNHQINVNSKNFEIVIDNILRNAIENYSTGSQYFIHISFDGKKITYENPSNFKTFDNFDSTPGITSKPGHMGMGLYIIKRLLIAMNYQFEIYYDKNTQTVKNVIQLPN